MHLAELIEGPYTIYAAALDAQHGGYTASAVVRQMRGVPEPVEVFRDEAMCDGQAWDDPERALCFATRVARSVLIERIAQSSRPSLRRVACSSSSSSVAD